ncbi:alpha/beta hydrolase [Nocardia yunnanensis]|uniref:Alpha/beta hydrolase n=1 Tax=Nocardia yunnanensis TaxID=2382165 RepID=A0A386ZHL2_9NOCA|nr:alpha/beta hydrolase [Nocardia yunnanensis]AYF76986.1 alpha/beta hydrolase [Nocardia yunnanensis]
MILRGSALAVLAAACLASVTGIAPATAESTHLPGTVDLPCATTILHQQADWYLPNGEPKGLVWLQHGFARTGENVAALAETLAGSGYLVFAPSLPFMNLFGCTLQNLGDNTPFLDQVAQLFATANDPAGPLATALTNAAARAGRTAPALPRGFVFIGHSAGAEAVEYVAHRLHVAAPAAWPSLRGLILLDPVKSFLGTNTESSLTDLAPTGLPLLAVSGPPSLCNSFGSGTTALQNLVPRGFLGVRLPAGEHTDAEGISTDGMGELLCGIPQTGNVAALQHLTTEWTARLLDGVPPEDCADAQDAAAQCLTGTA